MESFLDNLEYYTLDEFEFSNGQILHNVKVEYLTGGTPEYDENGNIVNAIIYCHGSGGNYSSIKKLSDLIYPGGPFDKNKYFFVSLSGLGSPASCSPSTTGLYHNFPCFGIEDMVNFQKKFLENRFNISHAKGIIGNSMGGFIALMWATMYPNSLDFVIALVTSYKTAGHNYILSKIVNEIIESDPDYGSEEYSSSIYRTLKLATQVTFSFGMSKEYYRNQSCYELDVGLDEFGDDGLFYDLYDVKYQNDAIINYNIEDQLKNIKAKVLIVAVNQDQYFPPELDAIPMSEMIENSTLIIIDSLLGHLAVSNLNIIEKELKEFMNKI